jgi:aminoglycoside phosphotransferase (APT) family kinase protein
VIADRHRLIADALGQSPRTILEIDDGYDFEVAIVDDGWVFRFPRRAGVEEALRLEIVLLPLLAPALPVNVPSFEHISRDPFFVGYRLIRGEPLVDEDADGVQSFLEALHALDPSRLPVQHLDWVESYREQCAEFERLVLPLLDKDQRPQAKRLFSGAETLVDFKPALLHADLAPEHLLVRDGRLAGVIDWSDARLAIPRSTTHGSSTARSRTGKSIPTSAAEPGSTTASRRGTRHTSACSQTGPFTPSAAWLGSGTGSE